MTEGEHIAEIVVGIDTHADVHVAVALSNLGARLGSLSFPTTSRGVSSLCSWAHRLGTPRAFGVEGTGAYGAGLARELLHAGYTVFEVQRPSRQTRRHRGKSDTVDAEAAARTVLGEGRLGYPKAGDSGVEMIRMLRIARRSALTARVQAGNQMLAVVVTAPTALRERLRSRSVAQLVPLAAQFRVASADSPDAAARIALRSLARRFLTLDGELRQLDAELDRLTRARAPRLRSLAGVGPDVAGALLVAAGDNPDRLHSEPSFALLCGVAPLPASSGKVRRHRLNRGGNREANAALWRIVITRLSAHQPTKTYMQRRTQEGLSKREIIRCLKRYVAREVYPLLALDQA